MKWLSANWLWLAVIVAMLWMYMRHGALHGHPRTLEAAVGRDRVAAAPAEADTTTKGNLHGWC